MASITTKLSNIINPEVMSDMIEAKIEAQCKITPYAHVNTDLQGTAGDTITVPSWNYIGDAEDLNQSYVIKIAQHDEKGQYTGDSYQIDETAIIPVITKALQEQQ